MSKAYLDTNALLDAAVDIRPRHAEAAQLLEGCPAILRVDARELLGILGMPTKEEEADTEQRAFWQALSPRYTDSAGPHRHGPFYGRKSNDPNY